MANPASCAAPAPFRGLLELATSWNPVSLLGTEYKEAYKAAFARAQGTPPPLPAATLAEVRRTRPAAAAAGGDISASDDAMFVAVRENLGQILSAFKAQLGVQGFAAQIQAMPAPIQQSLARDYTELL